MVANVLTGALEHETADWQGEELTRAQSPLEARLSGTAFDDDSDIDLPAGTRREQTIIQIRLMNPGASREMLDTFTDSALSAYLSHLKMAAGPRGPHARIFREPHPSITRHLPDRD